MLWNHEIRNCFHWFEWTPIQLNLHRVKNWKIKTKHLALPAKISFPSIKIWKNKTKKSCIKSFSNPFSSYIQLIIMHVLLPGTKYFAFIVKLIEPVKFTNCIYLYLHSFREVCSVGLLLNQQKIFCPSFDAYIMPIFAKKKWRKGIGKSPLVPVPCTCVCSGYKK